MKRRFEFKDEKSDKFWEYETRGASPAQEKLSKGYVEVATLDEQIDIGFGNKSKPRKVTESTSDDSDDMWDELIKNIKAQ